jgi:hypothetical protein
MITYHILLTTMPNNTRVTNTIQIHQHALPHIRTQFKNIATFSGNGCFIKCATDNTLEISAYSGLAITRAIAEIRLSEGIALRYYLDSNHYRPNKYIMVYNTINNDLFTRIRQFVKDGCFLFPSSYNNIQSVYIKANSQSTVDLATYIIQQTDLKLPIVLEPPTITPTMVELLENYMDTIDIIGKITNTHILVQSTPITTYTIQSLDFHSIEYALLLINNFEHAMDTMKLTNDNTYVTSYHVSMENLLGA